MDRLSVVIEELRGFLGGEGLADNALALRAGVGSHKTLSKLWGANPNLTARSLHRLFKVAPPNLPVRATDTAGEFSRSRKLLLQPEQILVFDPKMIRSAAAARARGHPIEDEVTAFHVIEPDEQDIKKSVFRRWQTVEGVESGTDFTGTSIYDVPDPVIREEFAEDLRCVVGCMQPQYSIIRRQRTAVNGGAETDRLFTRVLLPRVSASGGLEVVLVRRMQESEAIFGLFPQLRLGAPC